MVILQGATPENMDEYVAGQWPREREEFREEEWLKSQLVSALSG